MFRSCPERARPNGGGVGLPYESRHRGAPEKAHKASKNRWDGQLPASGCFSRLLSLLLDPPEVPSFLALSFVCLKHKNSIPVAQRVSASVFFTPSRLACRFSSPGRRAYACEIFVYKSDSVWSAEGVT